MNEKNNTVLKISLLPLVILIIIILGAGYFLLQGEIKLPKFNSGPTIRRLEGYPTLVYTEENLERQKSIITSEEELNTFLNYVDDSGLLTFRDNVNFKKEFLIGVSSKTNIETGNKIKIRRVYEDKKKQKLIIIVEETSQGDTCSKEMERNVTVDIIALTTTNMDITFDRVRKVEECD